jgi:uncharacterized glyoxalase superfamily protein PhnB
MTKWFARPVLHVSNTETALRFYVEQLGFTADWRVEWDGKTHIVEVYRSDAVFILSDEWPEKAGKGLMFVSLNVEPWSNPAEVAAVDALRAEFVSRGVAVKDGRWGHRLLVVEDPDGNQLYFPYPNPPGDVPSGLVTTG